MVDKISRIITSMNRVNQTLLTYSSLFYTTKKLDRIETLFFSTIDPTVVNI